MKKYHYAIVITLLGTLCFADNRAISDLEIQSLYNGANEMEMLNSSMERGMQLHNQIPTQPIETKIVEKSMTEDESAIPGLKEESDRFYYEETIPNSQTSKVKIEVVGHKIIIITQTTHNDQNQQTNSMNIIHSSSSSKMELILPENADMSKVKKSYKDGIVKIIVPKK